MKILALISRILFGLLFIFSAVLKMFPIESFELILIRQVGVSWEWVAYVSRALLFAEFFTGIALITGFYLRKAILASEVLLIFFSIYLGLQITSGAEVENCGCFGELIPFTTKESLIKNLVMMLFGVLVWWFNKIKTEFNWSILFPFAAYFSMMYVMLQAPFPIAKSETIGNSSIAPFETIAKEQEIDLKQEQFFLVMFAECSHCERLASSLSALDLKNTENRLHVLIYGHPTRVREFSELTGIEHLNPQQTGDRDVLKAIDGTFPSMIYIDSSEIQNLWNGASINLELMKTYFSK